MLEQNARRSRRSVAESPIVQEALAAAEDYHAVYNLPCAEFHARVDRVDAVVERLEDVARRIWSQAPTTIADIVARAIILESIMDEVPDLDPTTVCGANAQVHLVDAIRKVLRGRKYPRRGA